MSEQPKVIKDRRGIGFVLMPAELTKWMAVQIEQGIEANSTADVWRRLNSAAEADIKSGYLGQITIDHEPLDLTTVTVAGGAVDMEQLLAALYSGSLKSVSKEALGEIIVGLYRAYRVMV